jgi:hypothetical protein
VAFLSDIAENDIGIIAVEPEHPATTTHIQYGWMHNNSPRRTAA